MALQVHLKDKKVIRLMIKVGDNCKRNKQNH